MRLDRVLWIKTFKEKGPSAYVQAAPCTLQTVPNGSAGYGVLLATFCLLRLLFRPSELGHKTGFAEALAGILRRGRWRNLSSVVTRFNAALSLKYEKNCC